jgi:hypothetical protein
MSLLDGDRSRALAHAVRGLARHHVLFDRDPGDSYRIQIEPVVAGAREPPRAQILPALPVGSRWADACGWESYVVFPPRSLPGLGAAIVGLESVVPHPSRGAYPIFAGAVVAADDVASVLQRLAGQLDPDGEAAVPATHGVVTFSSREPRDHVEPAAWLLRAAAAAFAAGHPRLVRTVVLTEDECPTSLAVLSPRSLLLGTVPRLRARFARKTLLVLSLLETT